jgi:hypothetical protein
MHAVTDYEKLQDIDVMDGLPPVQPFAESPEFAALAAEVVGPNAAKRKELLGQMRAVDPPLEERMEPHALKIMEEHQRKGLSLLFVVGVGAFSITISAIAERATNPSVPAGTKVAFKLSREGVQSTTSRTTHWLARAQTRCCWRSGWSARIFATSSQRLCSFGKALKQGGASGGTQHAGCCLIFECVELINTCFGDVIKPFGEQWMQQSMFGEGFQDMVLHPASRRAAS